MNSLAANTAAPCATSIHEAMRAAMRSAPTLNPEAAFPRDWWRHIASRGLLGIGFGAGENATRARWPEVASMSGEIARRTGRVGLGLGWLMNEMLGRFVIAPHCDNQNHLDLIREMMRGEKIAALAISEPDVGAHPKYLSCRARLESDHWQLDGEKSYVSNGPSADVFVILAVTGETAGRKAFDAFVVDAGAQGLTRVPSNRPGLLAPLGHCGLSLQACRVPLTSRLRTDGNGFDRIARPLRTVEDTLLAGTMVGAMRAEIDVLVAILRDAAPAPPHLSVLGALQLELAALDSLSVSVAGRLESHGVDQSQADLNAGIRILLARWQDSCEAFARSLEIQEPQFPIISRDLRTVLGIARRVGEARHLSAASALINSKEPDEVPA